MNYVQLKKTVLLITNNNSFISKILQEILKSKNWKQKVSKLSLKKKESERPMANPKPYYTKATKKTLNNVNGSFGSCDFNIAIVVIKPARRFTRDPRRQTRADRRSAKDVLARIQEIVCEYCSPFLAAISSASRLWYLMHSSPSLQ